MIYFRVTHCETIRMHIAMAVERYGRPACARQLSLVVSAAMALANGRLAFVEDGQDLCDEIAASREAGHGDVLGHSLGWRPAVESSWSVAQKAAAWALVSRSLAKEIEADE